MSEAARIEWERQDDLAWYGMDHEEDTRVHIVQPPEKVVPATGSGKASRYTAADIAQAKTLHAGGFTPHAIAKMLGITRTTVYAWVDDAAAERKRARAAEWRIEQGRAGKWSFQIRRNTIPEYREAFMVRLQQENVPTSSIAKVCTVVFGTPFTRDDVAGVLSRQGATR